MTCCGLTELRLHHRSINCPKLTKKSSTDNGKPVAKRGRNVPNLLSDQKEMVELPKWK
jgi:hypothetical protein